MLQIFKFTFQAVKAYEQKNIPGLISTPQKKILQNGSHQLTKLYKFEPIRKVTMEKSTVACK